MNFYEKRNKIQILQERAKIYNNIQDNLYDSNVPEPEQQKIIYKQLDEHLIQSVVPKQQLNDIPSFSQTNPKPPVSVLTTSAMMSLGLDQYKSMTTSAQDQNSALQNQFLQMKEVRKTGGFSEEYKDAQRKFQEEDAQRQHILFKCDHLKEYEDATHRGFKQFNSRYNQEFKFTNETEEQLRNQDRKNNLQKNDLNTFFNVYVKHRSTLRK